MPGQYKNLTPRRKEILELHSQGKTLEEIGKKFEISKERVRQILKKLDVKNRRWSSTKKDFMNPKNKKLLR